MSQPARSSALQQESGILASPSAGGSSLEISTPVSSKACGQRSSYRRTPLGIRRNFNKGFKSPVQSPACNQPCQGSEKNLQTEILELKEKEAALDQEISQLESQGYNMAELEEHISLLHQYNELKDAGQMLLGRLAVLRGVTTKDLYAEFGMEMED
ncbi:DNA repair protein SWI5 homolog [Pelodytes ibericus]